MGYRLRVATARDSDFCFAVHKASMGPTVVEVFGAWDETVQREFHLRWFDSSRVLVIENDDGVPIGVFDVSEEEDHLYLSRIELLPEYQGRGIGSELIRSLQSANRPVRLHVFVANVRARALYERLGFHVEDEQAGRVALLLPASTH